MNVLKKMISFLKLNRKKQRLFIEAYFHLGRARYLKSISFSKVAPSLGEPMKETALIFNAANKGDLASISQAIHLMSRYTFWKANVWLRPLPV